ncbi:MAG: GGDEF domain-containing protein [Thermoleophilaceae bacterium]
MLAKELKRLSERDPLTGLYNRRRLHEEIVRQLATLHRHLRPFGLLVIDLDRFKQVNDTAGHAAGDALLVEVAHALKRQLRTADYVARVGGDEFVVLLPDVKAGTIEAVTEKLLRSLREIHIPFGATTLTPCASIGGVTCLPPGDEAWTPDSVLHAADLELYTAKAGGETGQATAASPAPPDDDVIRVPGALGENARRGLGRDRGRIRRTGLASRRRERLRLHVATASSCR